MPELFMISPAGFIAAINYGTNPPNFDVFRPVAGAATICKTTGIMPLSGLNGQQGTIQASIVVGAPGAARAVAFLVDTWPSPTKYIGIALDAFNRLYVLMSVGGAGAVSGQSTPTGSVLVVGSPINTRLAFNARAPVHNSWMAALQIEVETKGIWTVDPVSTWLPFIPAFLLVGVPPVGGISAMNGSVRHVQVSGTVDMAFDLPETEEESTAALFQANSVFTDGATVKYAARSAPLANSLSAGSPTAKYVTTGAPLANSLSAGGATVKYVTTGAPLADSVVTGGPTVAYAATGAPLADSVVTGGPTVAYAAAAAALADSVVEGVPTKTPP